MTDMFLCTWRKPENFDPIPQILKHRYNNVDDRESLDSDTFLQIRVSKKDVSIENIQWQMWNLTTDEKHDMETQPLLYVSIRSDTIFFLTQYIESDTGTLETQRVQ